MNDAFGQTLLPGGEEQAAFQIAELTFTLIVSARQTRHIVRIEETVGVIERSLADFCGEIGQTSRVLGFVVESRPDKQRAIA
jgi:hypothetical protein